MRGRVAPCLGSCVDIVGAWRSKDIEHIAALVGRSAGMNHIGGGEVAIAWFQVARFALDGQDEGAAHDISRLLIGMTVWWNDAAWLDRNQVQHQLFARERAHPDAWRR